MPTTAQLKTAYNRTALWREGISFEAAMNNPMFSTCLQRLAEATEARIDAANPPRKIAWLPYKDE